MRDELIVALLGTVVIILGITCIFGLIMGLEDNKMMNYERYKNLYRRIRKKEKRGKLVPKYMYEELNRLTRKINNS